MLKILLKSARWILAIEIRIPFKESVSRTERSQVRSATIGFR
jgi:hypothetical protein